MIPAGQIFVIGDSHIGLSDGSEQPIIAWLDRLAALQPRALYLNGDLFHYLIAASEVLHLVGRESLGASSASCATAASPSTTSKATATSFCTAPSSRTRVTDVGAGVRGRGGRRRSTSSCTAT